MRPIRSFPPSAVTGENLEALRHVLGFAVGHHADDADHQQPHADAGDSQHPPLVELLSLCGLNTHVQHTHPPTRRHTRGWIADTEQEHTHTHAHTQSVSATPLMVTMETDLSLSYAFILAAALLL